MKSEWKKVKINSLCKTISSGGTPSRKNDEYYKNGNIKWLKTKELCDNNIYDTEEHITKTGLEHSSAKLYPPNTIVMAMYGATVGKLGIIKNEMSTNQACCCMIPNEKKVNYKYLFYALIFNRNNITNLANGAAQQNLNIQIIKDFEIKLPPLPVQKKIAHILGTLDDKIELNRKMNETLEAMAQAIFKSWFVDFNPVHAKAKCKNSAELEAAAKKLGISKEILDLFPSEFEESELGMIPKGWKTKPLDQIAHYQNGLALQKFRPKDEKKFLPVLKIAQLKKGFADGEEKADVDIKPECIVYDGDVIFSWSGSLVVDIWCGGKVALNQHLFKVTSTDYSKWFYYLWTKQHLENFQRVAAAKAVTMGHIKRSHLAETLCVIPDELVFEMAEQQISPLIEKLIINRLENNSMQKTRDTLLPKLISGELDVSNIDMEVGCDTCI